MSSVMRVRSAEREAGGNAGHRPLPNDPTPEEGWPTMPPGLTGIARRQWAYLGSLLEAEGRLTKSDGPALDCAFKLQEYAGLARRKLSTGKATCRSG